MLNVILKVLAIIVLLELAIVYGSQVYDEYMFWIQYNEFYTDILVEE